MNFKQSLMTIILIFILMFGFFIYGSSGLIENYEIVPCYDEYKNEMIGIDCYEDYYPNSWADGIGALFGLILIGFMFWSVFLNEKR